MVSTGCLWMAALFPRCHISYALQRELPRPCKVTKGVLGDSSDVLAGFTIAYNNFPDGWKWANRITPVTWIIYGLSASQLGDNQTPLKGPGMAADATVSSYLSDTFGYEHYFRWYALLIVIAYVIGFMLLAVGFMHKSFLKR